MSIELNNVTKIYGNQTVVDSISFSAKAGEIVGFLGPNGAGKSTTMKMLTGFIKPSQGTVLVQDIDVINHPIKAQQQIGYLPEHNPLYVDMYVREYLQFCAGVHRVDKTAVRDTIAKLGLASEAHKKIKQLSKGYRQRVGIAAAILHDPDVLILDEPTTGLDPNQLIEIRQLIKDLGTHKVVLLSTHIMQEVDAICNRVLIINKGKIVMDAQLSDLKKRQSQKINVAFDYKIEEQFLKQLPNIVNVKNNYDNSWLLTFSSDEDMRPHLFDFATTHELKILELNTQNNTLERLFHQLTSE